MKRFDYSTCPQSDSVVVMAGGVSVRDNGAFLKDYAKKHNSLVISTNYVHPNAAPSDYVYCGDTEKLKEFTTSAKGKRWKGTIILAHYMQFWLKYHYRHRYGEYWCGIKRKYTTYKIGNSNRRRILKDQWNISPAGALSFMPAPGGVAALAAGCIAKPKRILIAGLDGPVLSTLGNKRPEKIMYNGRKKRYRSRADYRFKRRIIETKLLPFIQKLGIRIECLADSPLWGIDKKSFDIVSVN